MSNDKVTATFHPEPVPTTTEPAPGGFRWRVPGCAPVPTTTEPIPGGFRWRVPGCATCAAEEKRRSLVHHDPSRMCESGARAHCTCDRCF